MDKLRRSIIVCRDLQGLSHEAAERFEHAVQESKSANGRFSVALSGGGTPRSLYTLLAEAPYRTRIPWDRIHLFWGDERCVPPEHPDSNYRMVERALISRVGIPAENVHRMKGELPDAREAAAWYEAELREWFRLGPGMIPRFDCVLLGLGTDGHTASIFPKSEALTETERLVTTSFSEATKTWRLTLTLPVLNAAAQMIFLVSGREKAHVLKEVLRGDREAEELPAQLVRPTQGRLIYLIDRAADAEGASQGE